MNSNYNDIIESAMNDYMSDTSSDYDSKRLKEFANEAISIINELL